MGHSVRVQVVAMVGADPPSGRPTVNGTLADEGHTLEHNGGEAGGKACISVGTVGYQQGVLEFTVLSAGKPSVLCGVTYSEEVDQTDASRNTQRYCISLFNGKVYGPGGVSKPYLPVTDEVTEVAVRLDMDLHTISFAFNGAGFPEQPAFDDLPANEYWWPYFSLGAGCSVSVV